jgi:hypothetical protein
VKIGWSSPQQCRTGSGYPTLEHRGWCHSMTSERKVIRIHLCLSSPSVSALSPTGPAGLYWIIHVQRYCTLPSTVEPTHCTVQRAPHVDDYRGVVVRYFTAEQHISLQWTALHTYIFSEQRPHSRCVGVHILDLNVKFATKRWSRNFDWKPIISSSKWRTRS